MVESTQASTRFSRGVALLLVFELSVACALSAKTAYDVYANRHWFPSWFAPLLAAAAAGLIGFSALVCVLVLRRGQGEWPTNRSALPLLAALPVVGLCTTSLHGFAPFRPDLVGEWSGLTTVMKLNMGFSLLAVLGPIAAVVAYWRGKRELALGVLAALGLILLLPNDDCYNAFNFWWLDQIGASPIMFLPVVYALLFAAAALLGVSFPLMALAVAGLGLGVLALGLGHVTQFIW
jgi:hypothetical protein